MARTVEPSKPIAIGLVGAGMIGRFRADAVDRTPGLRLAAVADPVPEALAKLTRERPGVTAYGDGRALVAAPDLDAVIISAPPGLHEPLGVACLRAGKHLLCEKPLATSVAACESLVRAADESGASLATGFNLRYLEAAQLARRLVDDGAIGELDHVRAFHGYSAADGIPNNWMRDPAMSGGGSLMDNGIHVIDMCRWFLGDVRDVVGYSSNHMLDIPGCEDNGFVLMRNADGRVATLHSTWAEWRGYGYRVEVYGTHGYVRFGYPPMHLMHGRRMAGGKVSTRRYLFPTYQLKERIRGWQWGLHLTLFREMTAWADALRAGVPPPITGRDGLEAVRIAQAAQPVCTERGRMLPRRRDDG
ncbi:MAG: Gfo/Idh/MocA family oxidoreductase [Gemmataceae bacterium]